jgi:hypothetical protein
MNGEEKKVDEKSKYKKKKNDKRFFNKNIYQIKKSIIFI